MQNHECQYKNKIEYLICLNAVSLFPHFYPSSQFERAMSNLLQGEIFEKS